MKNDIDIKKLEELKDNHKNKNLLTIGLNDSQVVNTTSSFLKKWCQFKRN